MHSIEKWCIELRHSAFLRRAGWLWHFVRPAYNAVLSQLAPSGLARVINGTDRMLVLPELRGVTEIYEPEVWARVMSEIQAGDCIADVGAYVGLYAIAFAQRVGREGRVVAFEPDAENFEKLQRQISLNHLEATVEMRPVAVAEHDGVARFKSGRSVQSHITTDANEGEKIDVCRLDSLFPNSKVDILKIDVEGFEEKVLDGAQQLLGDERRKPRAIFVEVHPYNWHLCGTTSDSLIRQMTDHGYTILDLKGEDVSEIKSYGEIVALYPAS